MLDLCMGMVAQQAVLTFESMRAFVLLQLTTYIRRTESFCLSLSRQV
jgi:hypothetical protein